MLCLSLFRVKWEENEKFGDVMNHLLQKELFVKNPDILDGERLKVQQLVGKGQDGVSEVKEGSLRIPTTVMYGRKCYLLRGCWRNPPVNRVTPQRLMTTAPPMPYTGVHTTHCVPNWPDLP